MMDKLLVLELAVARLSFLFVVRIIPAATTLRKPFAVPNSSSLDVKRSLSAGSEYLLICNCMLSLFSDILILRFTKCIHTDYVKRKLENRIVPNGVNPKTNYVKPNEITMMNVLNACSAVEEEERQSAAADNTHAAKDTTATPEECKKAIQSVGPELKDGSHNMMELLQTRSLN
ncbi:hypothetical protein C5167_023301 [Papaver somniferum]|uniref:Uncharacterized protein n=1 Tax=Papaver somniferum TaxID=3469 RepID=A0A4Y7JP09_PAPSO|nr:hypothetical protein C5167_023301 [Papaver somniferum]